MLCPSRCTLSGDIQFRNVLLLMMFSLVIWLRWCLQVISIVRYLGEGEVLWENFFLMKMSIYLLHQYGLPASYITPIIKYHNPWLAFIFRFTLSLIWPWKPLQDRFYVTLTCPHHSLGTFLFPDVRCSNAHLLIFLLQPGVSDFSHEPIF